MIVQVYRSFDEYVSKVVGSSVKTGAQEIDISMFSQEFHAQLAIDLAEQKKRFEAEDAERARQKSENIEESEAVACDDSNKLTGGLDPSQWKKHDMYVILGLEKKRIHSTPDDIKQAYRKQVLRHHPDKLKQQGKCSEDEDSFFKCIQKAWEVLSDPVRKQQFDSVDPTFSDEIPKENVVLKSEHDFYQIFGPVFERNAIFSKRQPVPRLGDEQSSRQDVESFYSFWINFESWRRFEWLDEEETQGVENRADKRWLEKKNKAAREKHKKEDNARIIRLTELALKKDPRMQRWKEADKAAKEAKKNTKQTLVKQKEIEEASRRAELLSQQKLAEEEAKKAKETAFSEKNALKNAVKNARKSFRSAVGDVGAEWVEDVLKENKTIHRIAVLIEEVVGRCGDDIAKLEDITEQVRALKTSSKNASKLIALLEGKETNEEKYFPEKTSFVEKIALEEAPYQETLTSWTAEEIDLLINTVKQFPGGTVNRWEQITLSLNRQLVNTNKGQEWSVDQVIKMANEIKTKGMENVQDSSLKNTKRDPRVDQSTPTIASHYVEIVKKTDTSNAANNTVWSADDQLALEKAMKSIPSDDPERWDKVAQLVPGKTRKECLLRVKEIALQLKSKK